MKSQIGLHDVSNRLLTPEPSEQGVASFDTDDGMQLQPPTEDVLGSRSTYHQAGISSGQGAAYQQDYTRQINYSHHSPEEPLAQPVLQDAPKKSSIVLKIIAILFAVCIGLAALLEVLTLIGLSRFSMSGISSDVDYSVGDSPENALFISSPETNDRDLATFDALTGCLESLYEERSSGTADIITVPEIRESLEAGSWPDLAGYGDMESPTNPQVWVRLAELSANYLEEETGESWEVLDFGYLFRDGGDGMVDSGHGSVPASVADIEYYADFCYVLTRVICTNGVDKGLITNVRYYRWQPSAYFEDGLEDAKDWRDRTRTTLEYLQKRDELVGRQLMIDCRWHLYVWSTGEDDPLRDPESYAALANELAAKPNGISPALRLTLLKKDTPVVVAYQTLSPHYPNLRDLAIIQYEEGRELLEQSSDAFRLDYAVADELLTVDDDKRWPVMITVENLSGELIPNSHNENSFTSIMFEVFWISEDLEWNDELCEGVALDLDCEQDQVIAAVDTNRSDSGTEQLAYVIIQRGVLPETPDEFCSAVNDLRDLSWNLIAPSNDDIERCELNLCVYVVDETTIVDAEGHESSFAQMREAVKHAPMMSHDYDVEILLSAMPYVTKWQDDVEPEFHDVKQYNVEGSIAQSREWRYGAEIL